MSAGDIHIDDLADLDASILRERFRFRTDRFPLKREDPPRAR